jgi:virulence-associated protein VapD
MLDFNKIQKQASKLHANVKDGTLKTEDNLYSFEFDRSQGVYIVTDKDNQEITRLNTRQITVARKWFKEYLSN